MKLNKQKKFYYVVFIVLLLDQITKWLVMRFKPNIILIKDFLSLSYTTNTGAAFGILKGQNLLLILVSLIVIGLIVYYYKKTPEKVVLFTALIVGGALGNVFDRIIYGYVVDFISFSFWPSFNVADVGVTVGVVGLIWFVWRT